MSDEKNEPISAKLRRWADPDKSGAIMNCLASRELGINCGEMICDECEREVFRRIASEVDREIESVKASYTHSLHPMFGLCVVRALAEGVGAGDFAWLKEAIERYYLPRPLFEDGEPVRFGDPFRRHAKKANDTVFSITYTVGDRLYARINDDGRLATEVRIKHPEVLDADCMPIEVGETLYRAEHVYHPGKEVHVYGIAYEETSYGYGRVFTTPECTVRSGWEVPENLTHRETDSQERIDMDAQESSHDYWKCYGYACSKCPAMFDGKIPSEHYGVSSCLKAQKLDLLRRQRELDGRDA